MAPPVEVVVESSAIGKFIERWQKSGAAERANYQLFLMELCDLLGVERPRPAVEDDAQNAYVFERAVTFQNPDGTTSPGRIDLYKRGCFVLEAKQGSDEPAPIPFRVAESNRRRRGTARRGTKSYDEAMVAARYQAEEYARALPDAEGWPPFIVVVDVGHSIQLFSNFARSGKSYVAFPDPQSFRITLGDLAKEEVRERLRLAWVDPMALDPSRRSAKVTKEVARHLARLAKSLEGSGHEPAAVAKFLMRCLFTMFAEDVGLLPERSFSQLLHRLRDNPEYFEPEVSSLWHDLARGGYSVVIRKHVPHINGGLFEGPLALPLNRHELDLLIEAAGADWRDVEPAIFGTLLEQALDPAERHSLGAHFTPREFVERLVVPTIVEPLRAEWASVQAAAYTFARQGKHDRAADEVKSFHERLCALRVLDPACGSGNFLYITLEHLKRLEGEVLASLHEFGLTQHQLELTGLTVDPHQLLGIEMNPRAAAIAEMVLWIGYLQWHYRTRGRVLPPQPVLKAFRNIECRDAVLTYERCEPVLDEAGNAVLAWDGATFKIHPVTGELVPDEGARAPVMRFSGAKPAEWPATDFIISNPPYLGARTIRAALGDSYVDALRAAYPEVPESSDFVLYWWHKAAVATARGELRACQATELSDPLASQLLTPSPALG